MSKAIPIFIIAKKERDPDGSLTVLMNGEQSYFFSREEAEAFYQKTFHSSLESSKSFEILRLWKADDLPST